MPACRPYSSYFLYDGTSPLVEMDASGNYKSEFVYGPAGLISHSRTGLPTVFFAYDALGSVQSVWTDSGSLVSSRVYDAYGSQAGGIVASATYDDPEIGYNGQYGYITDPETGLVLCGHRYYDPSAGRWLNRDPIGYDGGINTYRYCGNNPVMWDDPSGLLDFASSGGGGAVAGFPVNASPDPWEGEGGGGGSTDISKLLGGLLGDAAQFCADNPFETATAAGSMLDGLGEAALVANIGDDSILLYRGVHSRHPGYGDALEGRATPWGGHSDPFQHSFYGNNKSEFTSWTTDPVVAKRFATDYPGGTGVVLRKIFLRSETVPETPDSDPFGENEILIQGPVTGATVTPVTKNP